ncbi:6611_t:CDS:2, partial [Scutellospora calospora]
VNIPDKKELIIDLRSIEQKYIDLFNVPIDLKIQKIKNELYTIGMTIPLRKFTREIDEITAELIDILNKKYPHPEGIFTRRLGTVKMVDKSNERYFTHLDVKDLDEKQENEIVDAVFDQLFPILGNSTLMSPEETLSKWHLSYSWGFPYRMLEGENLLRRKFIHKIGGRKVFIEKIYKYLEGNQVILSVSHVFMKDEVLKRSKVELKKKIRSIIAQDPLTYYHGMLVNGKQNKKFDPMGGCAIGMSSAHAMPPKIFEIYKMYKEYLAMDITAMNSTMTYPYLRMFKKIRKHSYENHPKCNAVGSIIDHYYDNLYNSYLWNMYTGEVKMKHQSHSTGQSTVSSDNTIYCLTLFVEAFTALTGLPAKDFFKSNYITAYGISLHTERKAIGSLNGIEFLSKVYTEEKADLEHVKIYVPEYEYTISYKHNHDKLLMKFDDIKKDPNKNKKYLLERLVGLANNCAYYPDIHAEYMKFYEKMILYYYGYLKNIRKRVPIKTYSEVMKLQYRRQEVEAFTLDMSPIEKAIQNMKVTLNEVDFKCEFLFQNYRNMLYCINLNLPTASKDTLFFDPNSYPICEEFIIERLFNLSSMVKDSKNRALWIPLNYMDSIDKVINEINNSKVPIITAKTGASKSTDFIQNLTTKYSKPKMYSGTTDIWDDDSHNVCIHGYLLALDKKFKDEDYIICIDEVHEIDEDSLILMERYKGHVICLSATPISVPNGVEIQLSKSRNLYQIEVVLSPIIHLSYTQYLKLHDTLAKTLGKKYQIILGRNEVIMEDTKECDIVIDSEFDMGRRNSKFVICPSSHTVFIQRKDRTGHTCDGVYVRKKLLYFSSETPISPKIPSCYNALLANPDVGVYLELVYSTNVIDADFLYARILSKRYNANTYYYSLVDVVTPIEQGILNSMNDNLTQGVFHAPNVGYKWNTKKKRQKIIYEHKFKYMKETKEKDIFKYKVFKDEDKKKDYTKLNWALDNIAKKLQKNYENIKQNDKFDPNTVNLEEMGKIDHTKKIKKQGEKTCMLYAKENSCTLRNEDINNHYLSCSICTYDSDSKLKICYSCLAYNSDYKMPSAWYFYDSLNICQPTINYSDFKEFICVEPAIIRNGIAPYHYVIHNDNQYWYRLKSQCGNTTLGLHNINC